jgi:hypothetical protein
MPGEVDDLTSFEIRFTPTATEAIGYEFDRKSSEHSDF